MYYAYVTVHLNDTGQDIITAAGKFPSWVAGYTPSGWATKDEAKDWAARWERDERVDCWTRPGTKQRSVALQNPGYHFGAQCAVGITFGVLAFGPIFAMCFVCCFMYYYLVVWPQQKKRQEAAKWSKLRQQGDPYEDVA